MYNVPYFMPPNMNAIPPYILRTPMNNMMNRAIPQALTKGLGSTRALNNLAPTKGLNLFSRLGGSVKALKGINWGGLINNTSKTLNVVNQTIPLVRQVGPVVNNMKSMLKVASIFKDETDKTPKSNITTNKTNIFQDSPNSNTKPNTPTENTNKEPPKETTLKEFSSNDNSPTFFIN